MLKVLHLRSSTSLGGAEKQILRVAKPLRREGFELALLVLYRRKGSMPPLHPLVAEARRQRLVAEQVEDDRRLSFSVIGHIARKLKEGQFSLLQTHEYRGDILGGIAARLAGVKSIATVRGYTDRTLALRLYKVLDLLALRFFTKVVTVSEHLCGQVLSAGLPEQKVVTIYNAIGAEAFAAKATLAGPGLREHLGIGNQQRIVTIVGRLSVEKGHRYFLEGAKRVLNCLPETRFLIVGDGPLRKELGRLTSSLGVDGAISFLGYQREVAALMSISDVLVLSSLREGLPNVLIEAMALAKPIVATRVGGVPEIVRDGETGILVPPKDPERLAESLLYLLRNPGEGKRLGERGKAVVVQEFNVETMAHKIAEVYREVLGLT